MKKYHVRNKSYGLVDLFENISPKLKQWFGNSKVVDKSGNPLVMYHGTRTDFEEFHPWTHFGTSQAANERLKHIGSAMYTGKKTKMMKDRIIPVYLKIENPIRVQDMDTNDEATLLNSFIKGDIITDIQVDLKLARHYGIIHALEKSGCDGLVYTNRMEDQGNDSWVIFDPKQARSIFSF